jgi:hypothetical protein
MTTINGSARVGVITDQAGALSFMGIANVSVAKMVMSSTTAAAFSVAPSSCSSRTARPTTATVGTADAGRDQRPYTGRNQDGRGQRDHADGSWK